MSDDDWMDMADDDEIMLAIHVLPVRNSDDDNIDFWPTQVSHVDPVSTPPSIPNILIFNLEKCIH